MRWLAAAARWCATAAMSFCCCCRAWSRRPLPPCWETFSGDVYKRQAFDAETGATVTEDAYLMYVKATKTSIAFYWLAENESDTFDTATALSLIHI